MNKYLNEISRDLRAFGSVPFYFIVMVRAVVGRYPLFVWQLVVCAACFLVSYFLTRNGKMQTDFHVANAFALCLFSSLFYSDLFYTVFAFVIFALIVLASYYIKIRNMIILRGLIFGVLFSLVAYFVSPMF